MVPGTVPGHEGGIEEVGKDIRNFKPGDRVVVCSTIACGVCGFYRHGCFAQCHKSNPNGPDPSASFFSGPKDTGPVNGLQAERARIPFAATTMARLPDGVSDDKAILISGAF